MKVLKLIVCVLTLVVGAQALADDFAPAPFRGMPGSMYMEWSYDADAPNNDLGDRWDGADLGWFVPHPEKEDPCDWQGQYEEWGYEFLGGDPCDPVPPDYAGVYGAQMWAQGSGYQDPQDPCNWIDTAPIWLPTFVGRTGVMADFQLGVWDMYNFIHNQTDKDLWIQVTYFNLEAPGNPVGVDYAGAGTYGDPCELWFDAVYLSSTVLPGGWIQDLLAVTMQPNPDYEWFEFGLVSPICIDQIIIETLCYGTPPGVCGDDDHPYPPGDTNLDCYVDMKDLAITALHWLECTAPECD